MFSASLVPRISAGCSVYALSHPEMCSSSSPSACPPHDDAIIMKRITADKHFATPAMSMRDTPHQPQLPHAHAHERPLTTGAGGGGGTPTTERRRRTSSNEVVVVPALFVFLKRTDGRTPTDDGQWVMRNTVLRATAGHDYLCSERAGGGIAGYGLLETSRQLEAS